MPDFWNNIHIFGGGWAHGKDLVEKWVLPMGCIIVEKWDSLPWDTTHWIVTVPISRTQELINTIVAYNPKVQLINFAWLMWPTVAHDMRSSVGSFHALWWPSTQSNFRIAHATDGVDDALSLYLIERIQERGMNIINRTRTEHDQQMAFHQALTHAAIILHDSTPWVVKISPKTSPQTIADMILHNPYFFDVWNEFIRHIQSGKSLGAAYRLCMKEVDKELSTPNSENQIRNSENWNTAPTESALMNLGRAIEAQDWLSTITLIDESRRY